MAGRPRDVTDAELDEAYIANALFDAHRDDPEFGYRFLADEVRAAGFEDLRLVEPIGFQQSFVAGKPRSHQPNGARS